MNPRLRRYAPLGLAIAVLAALAASGLWFFRRSFDLPVQIALGFIIIGIAVYVMLDPQGVREKLTGRQARHGSNSLLIFLALLGILIVGNLLANQYTKTWDLTEDKTNTLASESQEIIKSVKSPVHADAYFTSRMSTDSAKSLLDKLKLASAGNFTYQFIDPEANPVQAQNDQVQTDGTIVLKQGGRSEQVSFASESEIINAIVKLDNPGVRTVYFLTGHGEGSIETNGENSFTMLKSRLSSKNYTVKTLNLFAERKIPEDALSIIIAGPVSPIASEEVDLIRAYLSGKGSLVYLSEPVLEGEAPAADDPFQTYLLESWGIGLSNDLVIDPNYDPPVLAVAASYARHPITEKIGNQLTVMPVARSLNLAATPPDGITLTSLVNTTANSWGENSVDQIQNNQVTFDQEVDLPGPLSIAAAAENSNSQTRLVVTGDAQFADDTNISLYGNSAFITNAVDWAAGQDNLINLSVNQPKQRVLVLRDRTQMNLIFLGSVVLLPLATIIAGVVVWINRRRVG